MQQSQPSAWEWPSFGPEGKGDSHWVSLSDLPDDNLKIISTDMRDYCLPTCIGTDKEQMQNLAEMLYAIYHAELWSDHISKNQNSKLKMFHDFSKSRLQYHSMYFWENVLIGWNALDISEKLFGLDQNAMRLLTADATEVVNPSGLHLLYKGYSWWPTFSWNCTLYEAVYTNGTTETEQNMHHAKYNNVVSNMQDIQINCSKMGPNHLGDYVVFFPDNEYPRWVVRHATGKELASDHNYDPCLPILGVEEVYRYYSNIKPCTIEQIKTEKGALGFFRV